MTLTKHREDVLNYALDQLRDNVGLDEYGADLHNELFNMDYFIIGSYNAREWIGSEVFEVIQKIKEYEEFNCGEVTTDFSDEEKVANMLCYVLGEEILSDSKVLEMQWDSRINENTIEILIKELEENWELAKI